MTSPLNRALAEGRPVTDPLNRALAEGRPVTDPLNRALAEGRPVTDPLNRALAEGRPVTDPLDGTLTEGRPVTDPFDALMAEVADGRFGHREHLHLTWLAVRRFGPAAAVDLVSDGIRRTARYAGAPQKYHATVSRAWVELVACHTVPGEDDFDAFLARNPALLDKRLLTRFYRSTTLASVAARHGWVPPDLRPIPGLPLG